MIPHWLCLNKLQRVKDVVLDSVLGLFDGFFVKKAFLVCGYKGFCINID